MLPDLGMQDVCRQECRAQRRREAQRVTGSIYRDECNTDYIIQV